MKYKLLLYSASDNLIKNFYIYIGYLYECMTTSYFKQDFLCHLKYFKPDAYVHFIGNDPKEEAFKLAELKKDMLFMGIPIIIIGNKEDCNDFSDIINVDLVITKPINAKKLEDTIGSFMETKVKLKKEINEFNYGITSDNKISEADKMPAYTKDKKHILIIDDDKGILKMLKQYLSDTYDVTTVTSARLGRKYLEKNSTDLILLDYEMPEESGPEFYKSILRNLKTKDIPVIFLTGVADREKIKDALILKPKGYLLKPIDVNQLCLTISDVF